MTHPMDFRELWAAREGLPTEQQAARKIATFAVIPAAMVGLLAGTRFVDVADPNGRLAWVCTATACGAGFGIAGTVLGIYSLFGFRPVAILADALTGMFCGLLCGGAIAMVLMRFKLAPPGNGALWPLLLIPLGAVAVPLVRAMGRRTRFRRTAERAADSKGIEPSES